MLYFFHYIVNFVFFTIQILRQYGNLVKNEFFPFFSMLWTWLYSINFGFNIENKIGKQDQRDEVNVANYCTSI